MRMTPRNTVVIFIALAVVIGILYVSWLGIKDHLAVSAIDEVAGCRSVLPGWPNGAEDVAIGVQHCPVLDEAVLLRVIKRQRFNNSLKSIGLKGQTITQPIAEALAKLHFEPINLRHCTIDEDSISALVKADNLSQIILDPEDNSVETITRLAKNKNRHIQITLYSRG